MKCIRIGNDINIEWTITRLGEKIDLMLEDPVVLLTDTAGNACNMEYSISSNKVIGVFYGKDQSRIGTYTLTLYLNRGKKRMSAVDHVRAFRIVAHTHQEEGIDEDGVRTESVSLESALSVPSNGRDGKSLTYEDLTAEQIEQLQKRATSLVCGEKITNITDIL